MSNLSVLNVSSEWSRLIGVAWEVLQDCMLKFLELGWIKAVRAQRPEAFARPLNLEPEIATGERYDTT
jgi:hypothetical protein